jgi:hypothetical protein
MHSVFDEKELPSSMNRFLQFVLFVVFGGVLGAAAGAVSAEFITQFQSPFDVLGVGAAFGGVPGLVEGVIIGGVTLTAYRTVGKPVEYRIIIASIAILSSCGMMQEAFQTWFITLAAALSALAASQALCTWYIREVSKARA